MLLREVAGCDTGIRRRIKKCLHIKIVGSVGLGYPRESVGGGGLGMRAHTVLELLQPLCIRV